jgi:hypothetical protein
MARPLYILGLYKNHTTDQFEADVSGKRFRPIPLLKISKAPAISRQPSGSPR